MVPVEFKFKIFLCKMRSINEIYYIIRIIPRVGAPPVLGVEFDSVLFGFPDGFVAGAVAPGEFVTVFGAVSVVAGGRAAKERI